MESVKLIECPRDAWQGLRLQIPTERKVKYLRGLVAAGFRHIDAVSFVSPKAVPQMADSEQVLAQLGPPNDVEIIGIVVNEKGAERAIATGAVSTLGYPYSVSETFLRRNQNQSREENQTVLENIMVALLPDSLFMLFADKTLTERAKWIAERVGLRAVMDRRPPTLPFADLRRLELAKAIARDPKVVLVDEPFAGLTLGEVGIFSELIRSFRDEGRAVLLVDHNVKSVAALVDPMGNVCAELPDWRAGSLIVDISL